MSYIATKLKRADSSGSHHERQPGGINALILRENRRLERLRHLDIQPSKEAAGGNTLGELTPNASDGQIIMDLRLMDVELLPQKAVYITLVMPDGSSQSLIYAPRARLDVTEHKNQRPGKVN